LLYTLPNSYSAWIYKVVKWYYRKPRDVTFNGIKIKLLPTVFHPRLYLTTETFLNYLLSRRFENGFILELGCGSGVLSIALSDVYPEQVMASDINSTAVKGLRRNLKKIKRNFVVIESDLFRNIPNVDFDVIIINPPFFNSSVNSYDEYAFFTGVEYESIIDISNPYQFVWEKVHQSDVYRETHYIFKILF